MANFRLFLKYWLPALLWMGVVFTASCDAHSSEHSSALFEPLVRWLFPNLPDRELAEWHHYFRKSCHLGEYAILALLLWRAVHRPGHGPCRPWQWREAGLVTLLVFAYAASDEFHQIFVPTRTPLFSDVLVDTTGGAMGLMFWWWLRPKLRPADE